MEKGICGNMENKRPLKVVLRGGQYSQQLHLEPLLPFLPFPKPETSLYTIT